MKLILTPNSWAERNTSRLLSRVAYLPAKEGILSPLNIEQALRRFNLGTRA